MQARIKAKTMEDQQKLSDEFLAHLIAQLNDEETRALALVGSYARGMATSYSDVDVTRFVNTPSQGSDAPHQLTYESGHLISVTIPPLSKSHTHWRVPKKLFGLFQSSEMPKSCWTKRGDWRGYSWKQETFSGKRCSKRQTEWQVPKPQSSPKKSTSYWAAWRFQDEEAILSATLWLFSWPHDNHSSATRNPAAGVKAPAIARCRRSLEKLRRGPACIDKQQVSKK